MGKEGDLWDDSALINAFDHAISTYKVKKMHISCKNKGKETEELIGENGSSVQVASPDTATRDGDWKNNIPTIDVPDSTETSCVSKLKETQLAESQLHQPCLNSTNGQEIQCAYDGYTYGPSAGDYNQLVAQYYELEEKKLKILEQINQYGGWNHQYAATASTSRVPYSNAQDYSMSTCHQVCDPNAVCSCCPCFSQCALARCTSVPSCSVGGSCAAKPCNNYSVEIDPKMLFPSEDAKIHKMAIGAAERALSTIRTTVSADLNVNEDIERKNSEAEQIDGSETDLTAVLNAWYSAGFYTGKYLVEQSMGNRRQK